MGLRCLPALPIDRLCSQVFSGLHHDDHDHDDDNEHGNGDGDDHDDGDMN